MFFHELARFDGRHKAHQRLPQRGVGEADSAAAADVLRRHLIDVRGESLIDGWEKITGGDQHYSFTLFRSILKTVKVSLTLEPKCFWFHLLAKT